VVLVVVLVLVVTQAVLEHLVKETLEEIRQPTQVAAAAVLLEQVEILSMFLVLTEVAQVELVQH
jgi:hypothetical protein